jgi:hypothetical protein
MLLTFLSRVEKAEEDLDHQRMKSRSFINFGCCYRIGKVEWAKHQGNAYLRQLQEKYQCSDINWNEMPVNAYPFF